MWTMKKFVVLLMMNISGERIWMIIGMKMTTKTVTHNGQTCTFDDKYHIYTVNDQRLVSGTTFLRKFLPKFDGPKIAAETAEKHNTTPEALLKEWKEKSERASREGSMVHSYAEWVNNDVEVPPYSIGDDRVGLLTVQLLKACDKLQEKGFKPLEPEKIIFSPGLGIAGMIDLPLLDPAGRLAILDWKTNEGLTLNNPFQECLSPIDHLEDANLNHYALQLSLYQYIIITENYYPEATGYRRMIVHLSENDNKIYFCKYLEDEIESMFI